VLALGAVMTAVLWPERYRLEAMVRFDPAAIMGVTIGLTLKLMGAVVAMLAAVAIFDFFLSSTGRGSSGRRCRFRNEGRVQAVRRRPAHQGQDSGSCGSSV